MASCSITGGRSLTRWSRIAMGHIFANFLLLSLVIGTQGFNAPPTFNMQRHLFVNESLPVGAPVIRAIANDEGPLKYSISNSGWKDGSSKFQINSETGEITLKESLANKGKDDLYFYVVADDGEHKAKIELRITVISRSEVNQPKRNDTRVIPENRVPILPGSLFDSAGSKPNSISHTTPSMPTTTRRPILKPPVDKFNNPKINTTRSPDIELDTSDDAEVFHSQSPALTNLLPYVGLCVAVLFIFAVWTIYKCQSTVPTRSVIKTFSHKIVNNNKSDSIETASSSFSESDFNGALFRTRKSMASNQMSSFSDKSFLKVSENEWEFPRHRLKFIHILGEGCFGQVWKCEAVNINDSSQVVAVKTLKQNANQKEKDDLLEELEVMKMLEPHPNVITLMGCCTEQDPVLLIMEFIPNGTLQNYLRESRSEYEGHGHSRLTSRDLISFAYQIAKGMEYLSSKGVIHRDLAARNVLVGYNKVCKIADFGFAKYEHIYERKSEGRLPIRWMAIESLTDFIFTTKSDVWSFGILMWEIVTLGWTPYPGFAAAEVIKKVCDGYRLEKPEHCKREMFNIMYYCWDRDPTKRPSFGELVRLLDNILYSENDYIELDRFPEHAYYNILKPGTTGEKL